MYARFIRVGSRLLAGVVLLPAMALGQGMDTEPNNSCFEAQDMGAPALPFTIPGSLDTQNGVFDIDYFRFGASPGSAVRIDHQGASSGVGTLPDPLLGVFDADCNLIAANDDAGTLDSRLVVVVPADGVFIVAATAFPDFGFNGSGEGSYLLSLNPVALADSLTGRLVSASDGRPLPGDAPPFANVQLVACFGGVCGELVSSQSTGADGSFFFDADFSGRPLLAGDYQVQAFATGYEFLFGDIFYLAEGQSLDLGDIAITPQRLIGSIGGRIVDAQSGAPLPGPSAPFAVATLERCEDFGCFGTAGLQADEQGRFLFDGALYGLAPGTYRVAAYADEYNSTVTGQFEVGDFENVDVGDIALTPFPLQFGRVYGCTLPPGGGLCEYGIELKNRGTARYRGEAWSTIDFFPNDLGSRPSRFQVGRTGTQQPLPVQLSLRPGESTVLAFQVWVPGSVPDLSTLCATATVGRSPHPQFDNEGDRFVFCAVAVGGEFELMTRKEGRNRYRELTSPQIATQPGVPGH